MLKVKISNKIYHLPNKLHELSINKGLKLEFITRKYGKVKDLLYKKRIISTLIDCDINELDLVTDESINLLYDNYIFFSENLLLNVPNAFYISGKLYKMIDLNNIGVEEYTDIESIIANNPNFIDNIDILLNYLFKKVDKIRYNTPLFLFKIASKLYKHRVFYVNIEEKNVKTDENTDNSALFKDKIDFLTSKSFIINYLNFRYDLLKEFKMIVDDEESEEFEENTSENQEKQDNNTPKTVSERWGLYHILQVISNNNIIELDNWLKKPVRHLFTRIVYSNELIKEQNSNINKPIS